MKVFISWSGQRSKLTAEILSSWIRQVIQAAETWISVDIEKGTRWNDKINKELEQTKIGIICLNKENLTSEWILFEAGALSKTQDAYVCTLLLDISPSDVKPPLGQFQHTTLLKEDIRKLTHTINNKIIFTGEKTLLEKDLDEVFEVFWPTLESKLANLLNQNLLVEPALRSDRNILEEILQVVRSKSKPDPFSNFYFLNTLLNDNLKGSKSLRNYLVHRNPKSSFEDSILRYILLKTSIDSLNEEKDSNDSSKDNNEKNQKDDEE